MGLKEDFERAVKESKQLPERPSNEALLKLYSLYKQATEGDVHGEKPGLFDFVAKAKYEAWAERKGMNTDDAMKAYMTLVKDLGGS